MFCLSLNVIKSCLNSPAKCDDCFFEIFGLLALLMNRHQKNCFGGTTNVIEMYLASNANINNVISQVRVKSNKMFKFVKRFFKTRFDSFKLVQFTMYLKTVFLNAGSSAKLGVQKFKKLLSHPGKIIQNDFDNL